MAERKEETEFEIPESLKKKHRHGKVYNYHNMRDRKLKAHLAKQEKAYEDMVKQKAKHAIMQQEAGYLEFDEGELPWETTQEWIKDNVDVQTQKKKMTLDLNFGSYNFDFDRNGRKVVLAGEQGHLAAFNWQTGKIDFEVNVYEKVNCVKYLNNDLRFAVAQKEWTYVYDNQGMEGHCLKTLDHVVSMDYLPHHQLLVTGNSSSWLQHLDISVGKIVSKYCVRKGPLTQMCHWDGVTCLGHRNGSVTFWKPYEKPKVYNMQESACKVRDPGLLGTKICNPSHENSPGITSMCVSQCGNYMATAAANRKVRIFDLRQMRATPEPVYSYLMNMSCKNMQFSGRRMLCCTNHNVVQIFKDPCTEASNVPYLRHYTKSPVFAAQFCPFQDVLGLGLQSGFETMLVPGAGEADFDGYGPNPFKTKSQRKESSVKDLLNKLPFNTICIDHKQICKVDVATIEQRREDKIRKLGYVPTEPKFVPRKKMKGKGKSGKIEKRKQAVHDQKVREEMVKKIHDERRKEELEKKKKEKKEDQVSKRRPKQARKAEDESEESEYEEEEVEPKKQPKQQFNALNRFRKKK